MANSNSTANSGGIGVCGLLLVLFVALKLIGIGPVAAWSWWWVTAPMWLPFIVVMAVLGIVVAIAAVAALKS